MAAKDLKIKTYLVQHAGIEFDEVDYSYPRGISQNSNIYFFDFHKELPKILSAKIIKEEVNLYKPRDFRVINKLRNDEGQL